jgi:hypothetical protein
MISREIEEIRDGSAVDPSCLRCMIDKDPSLPRLSILSQPEPNQSDPGRGRYLVGAPAARIPPLPRPPSCFARVYFASYALRVEAGMFGVSGFDGGTFPLRR